LKILITGDEGFVGKNFKKHLDSKHNSITGIDLKNGIDVRDFCRKDDTKYDVVIHLAAIVGGRATIDGSPLSVASNLGIDSDFFQWANRTKPGHIVYFSSSAAYPIYLQREEHRQSLKEYNINLDHIRTPDAVYGWAKLSGEILARHAREEGLKVTVLRPFSGYGTDQSIDYPFPSFIKRGLEKADPFDIWGTGRQVRDFIHIEDVVRATFEAITNNVKTANLCTGRPTSFIELAEMVMLQAGYLGKMKTNPTAPMGVGYRVGNPANMLSFYEPKISLEEGISRALQGL